MRLEWKYFISAAKKQPLYLFRETLYFIVIFALVSIMGTMVLLPYENHKVFIRNSGHDAVLIENETNAISDPHTQGYMMNVTILSHPIDENKWSFYHTDSIELYMIESAFDHEQSYFVSKNLLRGNYDDVIHGNQIAITYNTAKELKVDIGDSVYLSLFTHADENQFREVRVGAIIRSGYSMNEGRVSLHYAKALIHTDASVLKSSSEFQSAKTVTFLSSGMGEPAEEQAVSLSGTYITREEELVGSGGPTDFANTFIDIAAPVLAIILMVALLRRETHHHLKRRKRDYGILIMLGKDKSFIRKVMLLEYMFVLVIASLIGSVLYKYASEAYMSEMVTLGMWMKVNLWQLLLGLIVLIITTISQNRMLSKMSLLSFIQEKE